MIEGLWVVQFAGMEGKGGGVVVLTKGHVLGGDSGYTYIGTFHEFGEGIQATVLVQNFTPSVGNVLGVSGDFTLNLRATAVSTGILEGEGSTPLAPGIGLKVKLTRRANMP